MHSHSKSHIDLRFQSILFFHNVLCSFFLIREIHLCYLKLMTSLGHLNRNPKFVLAILFFRNSCYSLQIYWKSVNSSRIPFLSSGLVDMNFIGFLWTKFCVIIIAWHFSFVWILEYNVTYYIGLQWIFHPYAFVIRHFVMGMA